VVKRLGREANHSPPISAEVKKTWIYISFLHFTTTTTTTNIIIIIIIIIIDANTTITTSSITITNKVKSKAVLVHNN
jgi:hypothetical protein